MGRHELHDRAGLGAVADEVAQEGEALGAPRLGVGEAGGERVQVRVDVGEERDSHRGGGVGGAEGGEPGGA